MVRRSTALRAIVPLLFCVLSTGQPAAAYFTGTDLLMRGQVATPWSAPYQASADISLVGTIPPPAPQLEIITVDRTGHPVNGIPDIYQPKYDKGYRVGYDAGYDAGFVTGKQRGVDEGTANGRSDGFDKGFGETYQPAFDVAYNAQLPIGKAAGWNQGRIDGFAEGYDWAPTYFSSATHGSFTLYSGNISGSSGVMLFASSDLRFLSPDEVPTFYYNLGLDDGNTKGVADGSAEGYKVTFADAYAAAFPIGYENGTVEGTSQGSEDGKFAGFSAGWELGYVPGFDSGFEAGIQHYLSNNQPSAAYGTLEVNLSGSLVPAGPLLLDASPLVFLGGISEGSDLTSEPSVPEPTSITLLGLATAVITLRRVGRNKSASLWRSGRRL